MFEKLDPKNLSGSTSDSWKIIPDLLKDCALDHNLDKITVVSKNVTSKIVNLLLRLESRSPSVQRHTSPAYRVNPIQEVELLGSTCRANRRNVGTFRFAKL